MITILVFALELLAVVVLFAILILLLIWMISSMKATVPFIPVPNSILPDIHKILNPKDNSIVYDLGCGDGRVLFYLSKIVPQAQYIGIENSLFPLMIARIRAWWHKKQTKKDVKILNQDFFQFDLSDASHIFIYLYPNIMDDLLTKFDSELKPGTKLVSIAFKFTSKQPIAEFDLGRNKYQLAQKIYIYEF